MSESTEKKRDANPTIGGLPELVFGSPRKTLEVPSDYNTDWAVKILMAACHNRMWNRGWWHDPVTGEPRERNKGELLCLIHSEISEAMEAVRKDAMDDKLPHRLGAPVELGDAIIRAFDMLGRFWPNEVECILEKLVYNDHREDHKPANRAKPGGKKF